MLRIIRDALVEVALPLAMNTKRLQNLERQLHSRVPLIGGWLRRRAFGALMQDGSRQAIRVLTEAVTRTDDEDLAFDIAAQTLWKFDDQPVVDGRLCS